MRRLSKHLKVMAAIWSFLLCTLAVFPMNVYAAEAVTAFGSNYYTQDAGAGEFPIGIYLRSDENIGDYQLELLYDTSRLGYVSGAESEENGRLRVSGVGDGTEVKIFLYFNTISGGEAGVGFLSADVRSADTGEVLEITELAYAPVTITGADASETAFRETYEETLTAMRATPEQENTLIQPNTDEGQENDDAAPSETETLSEESTEQESTYQSARDVYEASSKVVVENNRHQMLEGFIYAVIFIGFVIILVALIVWIVRRERQMYAPKEETPPEFPFEFDTISEDFDKTKIPEDDRVTLPDDGIEIIEIGEDDY